MPNQDECDMCHKALDQEAKRPFVNLCFVCALSIYLERLASFALKPPAQNYGPFTEDERRRIWE